mmetsp:Transcript_6293/g.14435  ORF Transcript_6293/g.14435 Transcript_6293/m.14435 type:complete len:233 (-) Transcript_6293:529-1227(-)
MDVLDEVAALGDTPQCQRPGSCVIVVQPVRLQVRPEVLCRLNGVIARQRGEHVVAHVRGADMVVEPVEHGVRAVDGAEGSLQPGPILIAVVRHRRIRVLQPRVHHQPRVRPHVWPEVVQGDGGHAEGLRSQRKPRQREADPQCREADAEAPAVGEQRGAWAEVVHDAREGDGLGERLSSEPAATRGVDEQVEGPAEDEVVDQLDDSEGVLADDAVQKTEAHPRQVRPRIRHV